MDTRTRIEAAKARLEANRAKVAGAVGLGPPCTQCRYYVKRPKHSRSLSGRCRHLAFVNQVVNPINGRITDNFNTPAHEARAEDGLCGPEAVLFESLRWFTRFLRAGSGSHLDQSQY